MSTEYEGGSGRSGVLPSEVREEKKGPPHAKHGVTDRSNKNPYRWLPIGLFHPDLLGPSPSFSRAPVVPAIMH
jgi:hypothetical protein